MIFSLIVVIISFLIEGVLSKYISIDSLLFEYLFTLISLIIVYPYFHNNENKYFKLSFLIGLLYDIVYTNTIFFNAFVFFIIAFIIKKINSFISNNSVNVAIISFIVIIFYRTIIYILLCLIGYLNFQIKDLLYSIVSSLILNMLYSIILYLITDYISKKKHITKID